MSNFDTFDKSQLEKLIEPFVPGMTPFITPIKFEALTPDCFLFLFRTTGADQVNHFFVSLEADHFRSLDDAQSIIEDWYGDKIIVFIPNASIKTKNPRDVAGYSAKTNGPYSAILAEVKPPTGKGYWASTFFIMPGDNIGDKIKDFPKKTQDNIRKILAKVLKFKSDPAESFTSTLSHQKDTMKDDVNQTDMAVSIYVKSNQEIECFYNYVGRPKSGSK